MISGLWSGYNGPFPYGAAIREKNISSRSLDPYSLPAVIFLTVFSFSRRSSPKKGT